MKCLILAAGRGSRISENGGSKPLLPLAGLPLIERTIAGAHRSGLTEFYVVTGYKGGHIEAFLSDLSQRRRLAITTITNEEWERGNGTSVLSAREWIEENFVLLMSDHVFEETILSRLLHETLRDDEIILAADYRVNENRLVDVDDVTKVLVEDQRIVAIGKDIENHNAYDTGMFLCSPAIFSALEQSLRDGDGSLTGGVRRLAKKKKAKVFDIEGCYWMDIDTPNDVKKAEALLYDGLIKPHDGYIARTINRKFSLRIFTPLLLRFFRRITANQVSILSFAIGLLAGMCFFFRHAVIGGLVIQLASILDGCDGEIARLKQLQSSFGNFLDAVLDRYADSFILFGIFYYSWTAGENVELFGPYWNPLVLGTFILAISGNLMVSYTSAKSVTDFGYRYGGGWTAAGRGRDLRLFVLFIGGILAWIHPVFVFLAMGIIAVLTNAIVLKRVWISWSCLQRPHPLLGVRLKAVIFDFDGTVANTMPFLEDLAVDLLAENYGIAKEEAGRKYRETTGMDFSSQVERIFPGHSKNKKVIATFEEKKLAGILDHPLFPEVMPSLEFFKSRNIKRFICTSTKSEILSEYVKRYHLGDWVDDCMGHKPGFTKDKQIESILQDHDLDPDEVLFVGDSLMDYEFVRDLKVRFIGIERIFAEREFQKRGLFSVQDLTALTQLWSQSEDLIQFVRKVE